MTRLGICAHMHFGKVPFCPANYTKADLFAWIWSHHMYNVHCHYLRRSAIKFRKYTKLMTSIDHFSDDEHHGRPSSQSLMKLGKFKHYSGFARQQPFTTVLILRKS